MSDFASRTGEATIRSALIGWDEKQLQEPKDEKIGEERIFGCWRRNRFLSRNLI